MLNLKDQTIVDLLETNARISYTDIAKKLGISETAVRKRIRKLEEEEIILGYKANINYKKLGFSNRIVMGVDTYPKDYFSVLNKLKDMDFVKNLTRSSGDHMIMFEVWIKNTKELNDILEKINAIDGVTESCPSIIHEDI